MTKARSRTTTQIASVLLMLLALAWLTVSLPFVNKAQQVHKELSKQATEDNSNRNNPFGNTTEEKTEGGVNTLSEYLHDTHVLEHHFVIITSFYKCHPSDLYLAFHPDLISPPPKA